MKKLSNFLIITEGPDYAGKTKLCEHLIEKYRFNYYHCGVVTNITKYHEDVLKMIFQDIITYNSNFISDRLHLSEEVYGNIFRNGPEYNWKDWNQNIINVCNEYGIKYVLILCLPPKDIVLKGHAERNAKGNEMFNTVDTVYDSYTKLYEDNKNIINMYKYDFTFDPDYTKLDIYLEDL